MEITNSSSPAWNHKPFGTILNIDFYYFYANSLSHGLLPKWLLLVALVSIGNSIQAYSTVKYTQKVYAGTTTDPSKAPPSISSSKDSASGQANVPLNPSVNPLSARTFGTWTFLSSVIRLYTALHIHDPLMYQLALWSYALALGHFSCEWLIFGTARWGPGLAGPLVVSIGSLIWMTLAWKDYVS